MEVGSEHRGPCRARLNSESRLQMGQQQLVARGQYLPAGGGLGQESVCWLVSCLVNRFNIESEH